MSRRVRSCFATGGGWGVGWVRVGTVLALVGMWYHPGGRWAWDAAPRPGDALAEVGVAKASPEPAPAAAAGGAPLPLIPVIPVIPVNNSRCRRGSAEPQSLGRWQTPPEPQVWRLRLCVAKGGSVPKHRAEPRGLAGEVGVGVRARGAGRAGAPSSPPGQRGWGLPAPRSPSPAGSQLGAGLPVMMREDPGRAPGYRGGTSRGCHPRRATLPGAGGRAGGHPNPCAGGRRCSRLAGLHNARSCWCRQLSVSGGVND